MHQLSVIAMQVLLFTNWFTNTPHQLPDYLIIAQDTIELQSFPLEELNFAIPPFEVGPLTYFNSNCIRGYQATWTLRKNKLYLVKITKPDTPNEKIDAVAYFHQNDYTPIIVQEEMIFADWYSMSFKSFPTPVQKCVYLLKTYKPLHQKYMLRIKEGVVVQNRLN